jgi:hypothetical protein
VVILMTVITTLLTPLLLKAADGGVRRVAGSPPVGAALSLVTATGEVESE